MTASHSGEQIEKDIITFTREHFNVPENVVIDSETQLFRNGIVDSLGILALIRFLERHFKIKVEPSEMLLENFETVEAMRDFVREKAS